MLETQIQIQASSCYLIVVCGYCFTSCFSCILRNRKKKKKERGRGGIFGSYEDDQAINFLLPFLKLFYL